MSVRRSVLNIRFRIDNDADTYYHFTNIRGPVKGEGHSVGLNLSCQTLDTHLLTNNKYIISSTAVAAEKAVLLYREHVRFAAGTQERSIAVIDAAFTVCQGVCAIPEVMDMVMCLENRYQVGVCNSTYLIQNCLSICASTDQLRVLFHHVAYGRFTGQVDRTMLTVRYVNGGHGCSLLGQSCSSPRHCGSCWVHA